MIYTFPLWKVIQIWGGGVGLSVTFTDTYVSKRLPLFLERSAKNIHISIKPLL